jgi:hypothetical protein
VVGELCGTLAPVAAVGSHSRRMVPAADKGWCRGPLHRWNRGIPGPAGYLAGRCKPGAGEVAASAPRVSAGIAMARVGFGAAPGCR